VTHGAVYTNMYVQDPGFDTYYDSVNFSYFYNGSSENSNHAVAIVGWDDNFSASKFKVAPPGNGAYIIRNSWGSEFGESGYFYISYHDKFIGEEAVVYNRMESSSNYDKIYQYDPLGNVMFSGFGTTGYFANVFTSESDEFLKAVSFYSPDYNVSYEITVYKSPDSGPVNLSGEALRDTGTLDYPGYHTVGLSRDIELLAGEKFSVMIKLITSVATPIALESPLNGYSSKATAGAGESYVSTDGTSWIDLTTQSQNTNVCLKAFTTGTPSFTLSVEKIGDGSGEVFDNSGKINCGSTCSASFDEFATPELQAVPHTGSVFKGWSGDDCTGTESCNILLNRAKSVKAEFEKIKYKIDITYSAGGSVEPSGVVQIGYGESVTLSIKPDSGYIIDRILVNGAPSKLVAKYGFDNVLADQTFHVDFAEGDGVCQVLEDFLELKPEYNSYLVFDFKGVINEYGTTHDEGDGSFRNKIRGEEIDLDGRSKRAEYYALDNMIAVQGVGDMDSNIGMVNLNQIFMDRDDLQNMKATGGFSLPAQLYSGVLISRAILNRASGKIRKICHEAFSSQGEFMVCHGGNSDFLPGETLEAYGNIQIYDDVAGVKEVFDNMLKNFCDCYDDSGELTDCQEDECQHDESEDLACGFNGNGTLYRRCFYGLWSDMSDCNDPDLCSSESRNSGDSCENGSGILVQRCVQVEGGIWDFGEWRCEVCDDDEIRDGTTACGRNMAGLYIEECVNGRWSETAECNDPDECTNGSEEDSSEVCGLNGAGKKIKKCENGKYVISEDCNDPDQCENGITEQGEACGTNNGVLVRKCSGGSFSEWQCEECDEDTST